MKKNPTLKSLTRTLSRLPALPVTAGALANLFAWGGRRRRSASPGYLVAGGIVAGAAAALLLNPWNGRNLRSRVGKVLGSGVGKVLGAQLGAHPIGAANAVKTTKNFLSSNA